VQAIRKHAASVLIVHYETWVPAIRQYGMFIPIVKSRWRLCFPPYCSEAQ
jgi:hypothetical protein